MQGQLGCDAIFLQLNVIFRVDDLALPNLISTYVLMKLPLVQYFVNLMLSF